MITKPYINIILAVAIGLISPLSCYAEADEEMVIYDEPLEETVLHDEAEKPIQEYSEDFAAIREADILNKEREYEEANTIERPVYEQPKTPEEVEKETALDVDSIDSSITSDSGGDISEAKYSLDSVNASDYEIMPLATDNAWLETIATYLQTISRYLQGNGATSSGTSYSTFTINGAKFNVGSGNLWYPIAYTAYALQNMWTTTNAISSYSYGIWDDLYTNFPVNGETDPPNRKLVNLIAMILNQEYISNGYIKDIRYNTNSISAKASETATNTANIYDDLHGNYQLNGDSSVKYYSAANLLGLAVNRLKLMNDYTDEIKDDLSVKAQLAGDTEVRKQTVANMVGLIFNQAYRLNEKASSINGNLFGDFKLNSDTEIKHYTAANLLGLAVNRLNLMNDYTDDIEGYLYGEFQLAGDTQVRKQSLANMVGLIFNQVYRIGESTSSIKNDTSAIKDNTWNIASDLHGDFQLNGETEIKHYTAANLLGLTVNRLKLLNDNTDDLESYLSGEFQLAGDSQSRKQTIANMVGLIFNQAYKLNEKADSIENETLAVKENTSSLASDLHGDFQLSGDTEVKHYSAANLLGLIVNQEKLNNDNNQAILSKLDEIKNLKVTVDFTETNKLLERIINLLATAGVIENTKDILDSLIGEFDVNGSIGTAIDELSQTAKNAFPFCFVFVVIDVLNLLVVDAELPVFELEIYGSPIFLDFNNEFAIGIAQVTSWVSLILLVVGLFINTKKFIIWAGDKE